MGESSGDYIPPLPRGELPNPKDELQQRLEMCAAYEKAIKAAIEMGIRDHLAQTKQHIAPHEVLKLYPHLYLSVQKSIEGVGEMVKQISVLLGRDVTPKDSIKHLSKPDQAYKIWQNGRDRLQTIMHYIVKDKKVDLRETEADMKMYFSVRAPGIFEDDTPEIDFISTDVDDLRKTRNTLVHETLTLDATDEEAANTFALGNYWVPFFNQSLKYVKEVHRNFDTYQKKHYR